jgi:hypothetical protein
MIHDSLNQCLVVGAFEFKEKGTSTYTDANNSHDILVALQLMMLLQLEDFLVSSELSQVSYSQMNFLTLTICPVGDGQSMNHNSFG